MKTFKKSADLEFDDPSSVEFNEKVFHLSGKFVGVTKKEFSTLIINLGGKCRGFDNDKHLNFEEMDYFILSDNGLKGGKPFGDKALQVQKHNAKAGNKHVPIIKESVCRKFIEEARPKNKPK